MPTSAALDRVAEKLSLPFFEVTIFLKLEFDEYIFDIIWNEECRYLLVGSFLEI